MHACAVLIPCGRAMSAVIKLKQVEHVRNERRTLAAVAGHPFITTLIATFSDDQSIYMVVRATSHRLGHENHRQLVHFAV